MKKMKTGISYLFFLEFPINFALRTPVLLSLLFKSELRGI